MMNGKEYRIMTNTEKTIEMARRVGLPRHTAVKIMIIALDTAARTDYVVDMVQVACAIKYAAMNQHLLKPQWQ
jgi:hypothetical protein